MPHEIRETTHVLLVDDDRPILMALADSMRRAGYVVSEAQAGEAALELARALCQHTDLPFLFMSAHSEIDVVKDAAEYGALGYLLKPLTIAQIVPAIEAALARADDLRKLRENEAHLNVALASGREINIAIGIVMERSRVDRQGAFDILRIHARSQRRKMSDVAEEFVKAAEVINFIR